MEPPLIHSEAAAYVPVWEPMDQLLTDATAGTSQLMRLASASLPMRCGLIGSLV